MNKLATRDVEDARQSRAAHAIHANALVLGEAGVLIRGPSGSGKSSLTLALLALARDRGRLGALIGDDRVLIAVRGRRILASGAPSVRGLIERRGYGVVQEPAEPSAVIRLVVDLSPPGEFGPRLPDEDALRVSLEEIDLPRLAFDAVSDPLERAYAVLRHLDKISDETISGIAHFT